MTEEFQEIKVKCPQCGRSLTAVPMMQAAITVHKRSCSRCKSRWTLRVSPLKVDMRKEVAIHQLQWIASGG